MNPRWRLGASVGVCAVLLGAAAVQLSMGEERESFGDRNRVVVVGVPGLNWSDVDPETTPELSALAESEAVGSLTTRGASSFACPRDGWVTLGAGNRARHSDANGTCHTQYLPDRKIRPDVVIEANETRNFGAEPGLLGQEIGCVRTYGRDAQLATINAPAVRPAGTTPTSPEAWSQSWRGCPLALVAGPVLRHRAEAALAEVDQQIGQIADAVAAEPSTLLLVVGVSDRPTGEPAMHVALAAGAGVDPGQLVSASTGRVPYVQLIDVAPTILVALGQERPSAMAGRPMTIGERDASATERRDQLDEAAAAAAAHHANAATIVTTWVLVTAAAVVVGVVLSYLGRWRIALRAGMVVVAAFPVATLLANLVPWWRSDRPTVAWVGGLLAAAVIVAGVALAGPWRRHRFGPAVAVGVISVGVLAGDVVTGSHLQLNGLLGYNPIVAGRFTGFGNMPFAIFAVGGLIALAGALHRQPPVTARWLAAGFGVTLVIVDGAPNLGSDFGGVLALVPAILLLTMIATGIQLSAARIAGALAAGVVTVTLIAIVDYQRAADNQTHLGRFVGQLLDGTAWEIVERKMDASWHLLLHSTVAILAPILIAALVVLFWPRAAPGRRLLATASPTAVAAGVGVATAALLGTLLNDSGIAVFVAAGTVAVPLLLSSLAAPTPGRLESRPIPSDPVAQSGAGT